MKASPTDNRLALRELLMVDLHFASSIESATNTACGELSGSGDLAAVEQSTVIRSVETTASIAGAAILDWELFAHGHSRDCLGITLSSLRNLDALESPSNGPTTSEQRTGVMSFPDPRMELRDKIARFGWAIVDVNGTKNEPKFSYSVGLTSSFSHPEIIVFGLSISQSHGVLKTIERELRGGNRFKAFETSDRVLKRFECAFRPVASAALRAYMGFAISLFEEQTVALHCIWPDAHKRFPWDVGATRDYRRLQPMLSEGPEPSTFDRP